MRTLVNPDSVSWRVHREAILLLGGGRALLMQIAHPLVAAGVADHSDFRQNPLGRLKRTMDALHAIYFGSVEESRQAYRQVNAIHGTVNGWLAEPAGPFASGTHYDARDPELLLWVHATLVDTSLLVYQRYVRELSSAELNQYYAESKSVARLFRIPDALIPRDHRGFREYMRLMLRDDGPIRVSATARELACSIIHPPLPMVPYPVFESLNLVTAGLMPRRLREEFELPWTPARRFMLDASSTAIRLMLPMLPELFRIVPAARRAERSAFGGLCDSGHEA